MAEQNPFGLHTVTPYLVIDDVAAVLAFVQTVLGAEMRGEPQMRDDGSIAHVEVAIGDSVIMMGQPLSAVDVHPGMLYVYVDDCDATFARALESGATEVMAVADYPHGDRYGGVRDGCGNAWWFVTHIGRKG